VFENRVLRRIFGPRSDGLTGQWRKLPLGRPRRRWEDNIKMDLEEVEGVVGTVWSWLRIETGGGRL
jgi:hypothetical protein